MCSVGRLLRWLMEPAGPLYTQRPSWTYPVDLTRLKHSFHPMQACNERNKVRNKREMDVADRRKRRNGQKATAERQKIHRPEKNIPNIIDCHLKKGYQFLIIFRTNIFLAQLAINWLFNISPHPLSVSALAGEIRTNIIWVEMCGNTSKSIPNIIDFDLKWLTDFNNFWCKHFWHYYLPSNDCFSSNLFKFAFAVPGKTRTSEIGQNAIFRWFCFPR